MGTNQLKNQNETRETALFVLIVAGVAILLYFFFGSWLADRLQAKKDQPLGLGIGQVVVHKNDLRFKRQDHLSWSKVADDHEIRLGDTLFTGNNSSASLQLGKNKDQQLQMSENSLIQFVEQENVTLAELSQGKFKMQVNGELTVRIDGELVKLSGDQASLEIVTSQKPGEKSQVRLIQGDLSIQVAKGPKQKLALNQTFTPVPPKEITTSNTDQKPVLNRWVMYQWQDVYTQDSLGKLTLRSQIREPTSTSEDPVIGQWLDLQPPSIHTTPFVTLNQYGPTRIEVKVDHPFVKYALEWSANVDFLPTQTQVYLLSDSIFKTKVSAAGKYFIRVRGIDENNSITRPSAPSKLIVMEAPKPKIRSLPPPILAQKEPPPAAPQQTIARTPATTAIPDAVVSQPLAETLASLVRNRNYLSSKISIEGSAFTMYSPDQAGQGVAVPLATLIGLRMQKWWDSWGIDSLFKTRLTANNTTAQDDAKPMILEGKTKKRWLVPFRPFSSTGEFEFSLILGLENYQNQSRSRYFSPGYTLLKGGLGVHFPMGTRWDTGGEILLGHGLEKSSKSEISGYLNHYINRDWSLGAGYRIHLFTAGSSATASPAGLPYREGFGEAFSQLRWHY